MKRSRVKGGFSFILFSLISLSLTVLLGAHGLTHNHMAHLATLVKFILNATTTGIPLLGDKLPRKFSARLYIHTYITAQLNIYTTQLTQLLVILLH